MHVFMESRERFVIRLRQQDVIEALSASNSPAEQTQIESALAQLCEWGNLESRPDTTNAGVVEDFYKQRYTFQITTQGLAAERALALFESESERENELQYTGLTDIRHILQELKEFSRQAHPDAGALH